MRRRNKHQINWGVRISNPRFIISALAAFGLIADIILRHMGIDIDYTLAGELVLGVFTILGIVNDPTTSTYSDSDRAMTYDRPYESGVGRG